MGMNSQQKQINALMNLTRMGLEQAMSIFDTLLPISLGLDLESIDQGLPATLVQDNGDEERRICQVLMSFNGTAEGDAALVLERTEAEILVASVLGAGYSQGALEEMEAETLSELANIVLNSVMETISTVLDLNLVYQVPSFRQGDARLVHPSRSGSRYWTVTARLALVLPEATARAHLVLFLDPHAGRELLLSLENLLPEGSLP
jgi:chemotaxis protein CheY-P-specific phosphatase CheC